MFCGGVRVHSPPSLWAAVSKAAAHVISDATSLSKAGGVHCLLPDGYPLLYRYIHRVFVCDAKCIIPCTDMRQGTVYTPFTQ